MADIIWSEQQLSAIRASGSDVLVSAAAGSGKTTVLTERLLRQILSGVDISTVLVVTFTEAAASHMRNSISKALRAAIPNTEDKATKAMLKEQLAKLPGASIKTLHSFCLDLTREYFAYTDMDLNSKVLDENESKLLKTKVLTDLLDAESQGENASSLEAILPLLAKNKASSALFEHIQDLYELIWEQPFPQIWMESALSRYCPDAVDAFWLKLVKSQVYPHLVEALSDTKEALEDLCHLFKTDLENIQNKITTYTGRKSSELQTQLDAFEPVLACVIDVYTNLKGEPSTWDDLVKALSPLSSITFPVIRWRNLTSPLLEYKDQVTVCRDRLMGIYKSLPLVSQQDLEDCLREQKPQVEYLFYLVEQYAKGYQLAKQDASSMDFSDMQRGAMELLWQVDRDAGLAKITNVAQELRTKYSQVLEDEYQDSNNLQEWILRAITDGPREVPLYSEMTADMVSQGPNMFMVGDIKQSIYGFRNAEPSLFISKYATYSQEEMPGQVVDLQGNYRSTPDILAAVNTVFQRNMTLDLGGSNYDHRAKLLPGLPPPPTPCEADYESPLDYYCVDKDLTDSYQAMVHIIQDAVTNRMLYDYKLKQWRKYTYSDIAILQRAIKNDGPHIKEALEKAGIPAHLGENTSYLGTYEIQTVISALRITDNPLQDKDLMAVSFSPMFDMPGEVPALLKTLYPTTVYYYDRMVALAEADLSAPNFSPFDNKVLVEAQHYCQSVAQAVTEWRKLSKQLAPERLIWHIITSTGFYNIVETMVGGNTRTANLRLLFSYAVKYSSTSLKGITNFIRFLEKVVSQDSDLPALQPLAENSVTITTIHKSKGLEFPLVIVGNMRAMFSHKDYSSALLKNSSLGVAIKRYDRDQNCLYNSATHNLLSDRIKKDNRSEELRVLYVALTRAQNHLALVDDISMEKVEEDRNKILKEHPQDATCFAKWVLPVALENQQMFNMVAFDGPDEEFSPDAIMATVPTVETDFNLALEQDILLPQDLEYETKLAPSKVSVTRVERMFGPTDGGEPLLVAAPIEEPEELEPAPDAYIQGEFATSLADFISGLSVNKITATARGTINHLFMEKLDFNRADTMDHLETQLKELQDLGVFTEEEAKSINLEGVLYACQLEELKELLTSHVLHRESSWEMLIDYETLMNNHDLSVLAQYIPNQATTLMQGIIDLWVELDNNEAIIVDYKTGRCTEENLVLYKRQLDMYATALTRLTGRTVTKKYVVFLDAKKVHSL